MLYALLGMLFSIIWIAYEMYTAPTMDDNGRIIKKGKKISDLWRKQ